MWKADQKVDVSEKKFDILAFLMRHPNTPIPHAKLLQAVLEPRIPRRTGASAELRQTPPEKIERDPARPEYILTEPFGWGIASGTSRIPTHPFCQTLT